MTKAVMQFVAVVGLHFPTPHRGDETLEAAWVASMIRNLRGYDPDVLAAAAQDIVDTRTAKDGKFFPLPSECKAACERAERRRAPTHPLLATGYRDPSPYAAWRQENADMLMRTETGQRAIRDGWSGVLRAFIVATGRMPMGEEIDRCRRDAEEFNRIHAACRAGTAGGPYASQWARLGDAMVRTHEAIAKRLMGASS